MPVGIPGVSNYDIAVTKNFAIDIGGVQIAQFSEVSGLESEVDVVEIIENGPDGKPRLILSPAPGNKRVEITLKRGYNASMDLYDWHAAARSGAVAAARKEGSIVLQDFENKEIARWNFVEAWVSKISVSPLKAGGNEPLMEECTIVCPRIERVS